jgi:hypothetical protein
MSVVASMLVKSVPADGVQFDRFCLKDTAALNMALKLVTLDTSQELTFWLNELALRNIEAIVVAEEVFQDERSWLKDLDEENMLLKSVTFETFQASGLEPEPADSPLLKTVALANSLLIFVTLFVFQALKSWLKEDVPNNAASISVTELTSQFPIG